ncbi:hypothetical protein XFUD_07180 [Xylella fastidiosa]|uniref:Uncharacterized protein n=1 Tax=Xylella fastidiosa (strain 9a5c) TaxID=160492 RepID=Q9P9R5_XYLFA|nr:hypothetical protein [Xylella fastidiosa]AAF84385.1 hypothetical protein XF_1576 [Xylella fastidiosa 9a5c]AAF84490.1 hypothetical protein XF_1681 [Xylella fastidiosa 9a5c]ALQ94893.1 hypothetical protein XFUD_06685 [Xylella fastidiosa]ALQ94974.1 hypothetical protein XFUD_07180 [Xylella fastidiosa]
MSGIDLSTYGGRLLDLGVAGQVIDLNTSGLYNYKNAGETPIDFGLFVARGPKDNTCCLPGSDAISILGVSVRHVTMVADEAGQVRYAPHAMVPVLEIGRIWVICEDGCRPDDPVLIRIAGTGALGAARSAAIASETIPYPQARWDSTTAPGALGVIRILN